MKLASCWRRWSSSRLRASAASRSSLLARLALAADGGLGLLAAAVLLLAGARLVERAGAGLALLLGQRLQHDAGARRRRARSAAARRRASVARGATGVAAAGAAAEAGAAAGRPWRRGAAAGLGASEIVPPPAGAGSRRDRRRAASSRPRRPCCGRAKNSAAPCPQSTGRFRCSVGFAGPSDFSPLLFVSVMRCSSYPALSSVSAIALGLIGARSIAHRLARPVGGQARDFGEEGRARRPRLQRRMYHICPAQCQIQSRRFE